jgi:hypothetical protein
MSILLTFFTEFAIIKDMAIAAEFSFFDNTLTIAVIATHVMTFTIVQIL